MGSLGEAVDRERDSFDELKMTYETVQPNRWTFQSKKIRRWVEARLHGRVLNACAGKTMLTHSGPIVRNDIDPERDADLHVDVCELGEHFEPESFDTIVYDPPFSENQANRSYELDDGTAVVAGNDAVAKRVFDELLSPGGTIIQFGYTTTCMPASLPYTREEVAVWNTLGRMNDYLSVIDRKEGEIQHDTSWFSAGTAEETDPEK